MKPEELINSLEHVGDDLLAGAEQDLLGGAEQNLRAGRGRPWVGAAIAAVFVLAMGLGGYALWNYLKSETGAASPGPSPVVSGETGSADAGEPEPPRRDGPAQHSDLEVGENYTGVFSRAFADIDADLRVLPWGDTRFSALPVYRNLAYSGSAQFACYYNPTVLKAKLYDAANRFGATLTSDPEYYYMSDDLPVGVVSSANPVQDIQGFIQFESEDQSGICESFIIQIDGSEKQAEKPREIHAQTDQGTLTVYGDGSVCLFFDDAHTITAPEAAVTVEGPAGLTEAQRKRAQNQAVIQYWMPYLQPALQMPDYGIAGFAWHSPVLSSYESWTVYPLRSDPTEQLLSYYFEQVRLLTHDGMTLDGVVVSSWPPEGGFRKAGAWETPEWLEPYGDYALISPDKAREYVREGCWLTEADLSFLTVDAGTIPVSGTITVGDPQSGNPPLTEFTVNGDGSVSVSGQFILSGGMSMISDGSTVTFTPPTDRMELVYLTETQHELLIPFYRFWVQIEGYGDYADYAAVYVPAIEQCSDFPRENTETPVGTEPDETEPGTEPTDPESGTTGPSADDVPYDLPVLSVEQAIRYSAAMEAVMLHRVEAELALSPLHNGEAPIPETLPVFRNLAYVDQSGVTAYYGQDVLLQKAQRLAESLDLEILSWKWENLTVTVSYGVAADRPVRLTAETDRGTIEVLGDGSMRICFAEPQELSDYVDRFTEPEDWSPEAYASMLWAQVMNRGRNVSVYCETDYTFNGVALRRFYWWERGDPALVFWYEGGSTGPAAADVYADAVYRNACKGALEMDEEGRLLSFSWPADAREEIGEFPIIDWDEADRMLRDGRYLTSVPADRIPDGALYGDGLLSRVAAKELVYRTGAIEEIFLPFYRYWIEIDDGAGLLEGLKTYAAFYVPAVQEDVLYDWPEALMPAADYAKTLRELSDYLYALEAYSGRNPEAETGSQTEIDGWTEREDGTVELRYWRGGDKMVPWSLILRPAEAGWEILSNEQSDWNRTP